MKTTRLTVIERGSDAAALSSGAKLLPLVGQQAEVLLDPPKVGYPLRFLIVTPGSPKKIEARNVGPVREIRVYTEEAEYTFNNDTN